MNIRYEEYADARGRVPFVFNDDIKRSATLFSENQNWHENIEIQYCKEGEGFVLIDGKRHAFSKGDLAVIDASAIHYTFSETQMVYACIIVSTEFCRQMGIDHHSLSFQPLIRDESLASLFEGLSQAYKEEVALRVARLSYLLLALLLELVGRYSVIKHAVGGASRELAAVKRVLLYIREHFHERITLDMLAKHALIDKYTLCKIFKTYTGQTVFENIHACRCAAAADYIANGRSVGEAARLCGFENSSFFTKTFKRYMGVLPSRIGHNG